MFKPCSIDAFDPERVPKHIAMIMDGNGRWAKERGMARTEGHRVGEQALMKAVTGCDNAGVDWITVYAFSTENWNRPKAEVGFLLNYSKEILRHRRDELHEKNVRIRFVGRRDWRIPKGVASEIEEAEEITADNTGMTLTIAFNYGGRAEIVDAVRAMAEAGLKGRKITEKAISRYMYAADMPDPELMIRTSGETRTSNYLMWQMAYTELLFPDVLWPDFTEEHVYGAIAEYQQRDRRFGGV